ncbi:MAG: phage terminase large subunit [Acidocella sp.]|nr:phage terminase large subunit [Acidocella sp.]
MSEAAQSFLGFAEAVLRRGGQVPAAHHKALIGRLEDILESRCDRLMVQMPPGYAKSTYGSILFPAYFLSRHQGSQIIATAHTASLAEHFGRQVRRTILENEASLGLSLTKDSRAAGRFGLQNGGAYFAAGVRGPITGRRADLILIDDPVKSWAEAESLVFRDALHDWYRAELTARLKPKGRVVLLMARWHEDDLAGRLMQAGGAWQVLRLPALAETDDPLGRAEGEALWPSWQDAEEIARRRVEVGERAFSAIYQQRPRPPDAALFNVKTVQIIPVAPELTRCIRAWDLAASLPGAGRNPDYTVGLKLGVALDNKIIILDIIRIQASPSQVAARIIATAKTDGVATLVALPQDPGQAGLAQVAMLTSGLLGYNVNASVESGPKVMRAMPAATQMDAGNITLLAAPWNENFLSELLAFPESGKDDQVDALSRAVNTLATTSAASARRLNVPLLGR